MTEEADGVLNRSHMAAGLSCLGRTGNGVATAFLKADLANLNLMDITLLQEYSALQDVDLQNNRLSNLQPLHHLPHLLKLNAGKNCLQDPDCLEALAQPSSLLSLALPRNLFVQVPELSHLWRLTDLNLDHNKLQNLNGLQALASLTALSVRSNLIDDLDVMVHSQAELKRLHLDHNHITGLHPLTSFQSSLQELTLRHNDIMHLEPLGNFLHLHTLDVSANNLHRPDVVRSLQSISMLRSLSVEDNPMWYPPITTLVLTEEEAIPHADVASDDPTEPLPAPVLRVPQGRAPDVASHQRSLKLQVIAFLPQLQLLDGLPVTAEDKVKAKFEMAKTKTT